MTTDEGKLGNLFGTALGITLGLLYLLGMYAVISDDHRYTTKHVVIGVVLFPYGIWIGGNTVYHYLTNTAEHRRLEARCLDYAEAQGVRRRSRLILCECVAAGGTVQACNAKYAQELSD